MSDFKQYLIEALEQKPLKKIDRKNIPESDYVTLTVDQYKTIARFGGKPVGNFKLSSIKMINRSERAEGQINVVTIVDTSKRRAYQCAQNANTGSYIDPFAGMNTSDKDGYRFYIKKLIDSTENTITNYRAWQKSLRKNK